MTKIFIRAGDSVLPIQIEDIPSDILKYGFEFEIDIPKVWALDTPTTTVDLKDLLWQMDLTPWDYKKKPLSISPHNVLSDPIKYADHFEKIKNSDIIYPIEISFNNGRWMIVDGLNRLSKLVLHGAVQSDKINVRIHSREAIIACIDKEITPPEILEKYNIYKETGNSSISRRQRHNDLKCIEESHIFSSEEHLNPSLPKELTYLTYIGYSLTFENLSLSTIA